ncbi:hypothetical protein KI387_000880, partial [Taxus chinensis]
WNLQLFRGISTMDVKFVDESDLCCHFGHVKGHLLGRKRRIGACLDIIMGQRKIMAKEDVVSEANMIVACQTYRDEDPLSFSRKLPSRSGSGAEFDSGPAITTQKKCAPCGSMDKIIQAEFPDEMDLLIRYRPAHIGNFYEGRDSMIKSVKEIILRT